MCARGTRVHPQGSGYCCCSWLTLVLCMPEAGVMPACAAAAVCPCFPPSALAGEIDARAMRREEARQQSAHRSVVWAPPVVRLALHAEQPAPLFCCRQATTDLSSAALRSRVKSVCFPFHNTHWLRGCVCPKKSKCDLLSLSPAPSISFLLSAARRPSASRRTHGRVPHHADSNRRLNHERWCRKQPALALSQGLFI